MRKRLGIVGHSDEGLALIPLLEANPDVELCGVLSDDPEAARAALVRVDPKYALRSYQLLVSDAQAFLRTPGLVALIDAEAPRSFRSVLETAPERGVQVTTPLIAKLLYAFGPVDAHRKPDLLHALGEILESYNLTIDRRGLLNRILQIAVGSTGADRGSLMLWDEAEGALRIEVAIGIEKELISKIRIRPGEGIAGIAFAERKPLLLSGKADQRLYEIARERSDVESAISAPLIHGERVLGVLNLSHSLRRGAFSEEDRDFVARLAAIDAKIITRAEEYHRLLRDSARLRAQSLVRDALGEPAPLHQQLSKVCHYLAEELSGGIAHVFLVDAEQGALVLRGSSTPIDRLASPYRIRPADGIHGWVSRQRKAIVLSNVTEEGCACFAVLPLVARGELIGVLSFEGMLAPGAPEILREKIAAVADALSLALADALRTLQMEREATKTGAITELAARLGSAADSAQLHRSITSSAAMILEAEHAVLRLQDPATGRYQIRSYFGSAETEEQAPLLELEKALSIRALSIREPVRVVDVRADEELAKHRPDVVSAMSWPLRRDGRVFGTLSLLGKVARDALTSESFSAQDQALLGRFAEHAQQALEQVGERERMRHQRRFDELTALPNATYVGERIEEEIARSGARGRSFALVRFRLDGLAELLSGADATSAEHLVVSLAQELRAGLREFDIVARSAPDTFLMLIPEPESDISALLGPLARRVREAIRREPEPAFGEGVRLEFGYALFPGDGQTSRALLEATRRTRVTD
ncbi:MAG: GAF domain-containing protein [Deltaproteobacteria bacterium]|nr:GAF domain-containing protein [Deltaproteobacteria bacterium]